MARGRTGCAGERPCLSWRADCRFPGHSQVVPLAVPHADLAQIARFPKSEHGLHGSFACRRVSNALTGAEIVHIVKSSPDKPRDPPAPASRAPGRSCKPCTVFGNHAIRVKFSGIVQSVQSCWPRDAPKASSACTQGFCLRRPRVAAGHHRPRTARTCPARMQTVGLLQPYLL
jgi:hypothetical protein